MAGLSNAVTSNDKSSAATFFFKAYVVDYQDDVVEKHLKGGKNTGKEGWWLTKEEILDLCKDVEKDDGRTANVKEEYRQLREMLEKVLF